MTIGGMVSVILSVPPDSRRESVAVSHYLCQIFKIGGVRTFLSVAHGRQGDYLAKNINKYSRKKLKIKSNSRCFRRRRGLIIYEIEFGLVFCRFVYILVYHYPKSRCACRAPQK